MAISLSIMLALTGEEEPPPPPFEMVVPPLKTWPTMNLALPQRFNV